MRPSALLCGSACLILALDLPGLAADKKAPPKQKRAFLDAAQAGEDFRVQGEYAGEVEGEEGKIKYGVQVVARGDHKFHAVAYRGGLPGDGWDGDKKAKVEADGVTKDGETTFIGEKGSGTVKDGVMVVKNPDGKQIGTLQKVVRKSPTLGQKPPENAVVLFDGTSAKNFKGGRMSPDGLLMQGATSRQKFQSFRLHLEFLLSYMPRARGQGRSNSGCYMQGRYEVQILDSFGLEGKNNECGGIYGVKDADVNLCLPPLSWQTYDVDFTAAKYNADGKKSANARMTVRHNGVVIHDDVAVPKSTRAAPVREGPEPGPIYLQNHGNPLRFRNIWVVEQKSPRSR